MNAEPSWLIPLKPIEKVELFIVHRACHVHSTIAPRYPDKPIQSEETNDAHT